MGRFPAAFSLAAPPERTAAVSGAARPDAPALDELGAADDAAADLDVLASFCFSAVVGAFACVGTGARGDDEGASAIAARDDGRPGGSCGSTGCDGVLRGDDGRDVGRSASRDGDELPDRDELMDEVFMALPFRKGGM